MFYFKKKGVTYGIKIEREQNTTLAHLVEVDSERGIVHLGIMGIAYLHPNDKMVKRIGRKLAIARLMQIISNSKAGKRLRQEMNITDGPVLTKKERENIWAELRKINEK